MYILSLEFQKNRLIRFKSSDLAFETLLGHQPTFSVWWIHVMVDTSSAGIISIFNVISEGVFEADYIPSPNSKGVS